MIPQPSAPSFGDTGCDAATIVTLGAIIVPSPIVICASSTNVQLKLM